MKAVGLSGVPFLCFNIFFNEPRHSDDRVMTFLKTPDPSQETPDPLQRVGVC